MTTGKLLPRAPAKPANYTQLGLDDRDRLVVSRAYNDLGNVAETFLEYRSESLVEEWSYGSNPQVKEPTGVARYDYKDGHLVAYTQLRPDGATAEAHEWQGGRLRCLQRRSENPDIELSYELTYDDAGELQSVTMERPGDDRRIVYTAPKKSAAALTKSVRTRLLSSIPNVVRDLHPSEPAFCLALVYDPASLLSMLPPNLAVGLESERELWRESSAKGKGAALIESLWDAQGFRSFDNPLLDLNDKALLDESRQLAEHYRAKGGEQKAHDLLIDLCKSLNKLPWRDYIAVTSDFIVYPVDLETVYLREDIRLAVPSRLVKSLERAGVL
jgi:hypothetical protein